MPGTIVAEIEILNVQFGAVCLFFAELSSLENTKLKQR